MTPFAWLRWARRITLLVLLAAFVGVVYVAGHIWWVARQDDHPDSDAIVVLGASQYNGTPSPVFRARLEHAKALYDEHVAAHLVTVGGRQPGDAYTEAGSGKRYLVSHGVPSSAVVALGTGRDTLQSMRAVAMEFRARGWHTAVLVTDPWHCLRARTMADDAGLSALTSPERHGPATSSLGTDLRYLARETEAYIYYEIFGNDSVHSTGAV